MTTDGSTVVLHDSAIRPSIWTLSSSADICCDRGGQDWNSPERGAILETRCSECPCLHPFSFNTSCHQEVTCTSPTTSMTQTCTFGEIKCSKILYPMQCTCLWWKFSIMKKYSVYGTIESVADKHISCCGLFTFISKIYVYMSAMFAFSTWWLLCGHGRSTEIKRVKC